MTPITISFFGSSITSSYWNGAATYYRGLLHALANRGYAITFFEPDVFDRQKHRDVGELSWAQCVVYSSKDVHELEKCLRKASASDLIIKASGVGVFDAFMESALIDIKRPSNLIAFWDVDAPATLDHIIANPTDPFRKCIPHYDFVFTYGGGLPVVRAYSEFGAQKCIPIYNALDSSIHFPVAPDHHFAADLAFLGNRLPDREARVDEFFFKTARELPEKIFSLGGSGWDDKPIPPNVRYFGHVSTTKHNVFNCSAHVVLNISRESMVRYGFSPATRVFEAAGAASCIITDAWEGISQFFEPEKEILVAKSGSDVADLLKTISYEKAKAIGTAAYHRARREHTYENRANEVERALGIPHTMKRIYGNQS